MNTKYIIKLLFSMLSLFTFLPVTNMAYATMKNEKNVLGGELSLHCTEPKTGFYRDGYCRTGAADTGTHVVAAIVTKEFLEFTKSRGNDLQTPNPHHQFPGLKPGDKWCLCALRWKEAQEAGFAPPVDLKATHEKALSYIKLEVLKTYQYQ